MSISSSTRKAGPFACNGSTVAFPFAFKVFTTADVRVVLTDSNSVESDLALGTNYTVALNADQDANPGGTVTTTATYATGYKITLTSQVQNLQPVTLTNQGGFYPQVINNALDRLTIMAQQLAEQVSRAVKTSISSSSTPDQLLSDIGTAVTNASNSATAAAGSATNSANSATASANSATASANSAIAAANSATQAANSAASLGFTLSDLQTQGKTAATSAGTAPAFTVTTNPAYGALAAGQRMRVKFHAAGTTGSNTLNRDGLGAKNLMQYDATGTKVAAVVASGQLADVEYDGTDMVILDPLPPGSSAAAQGAFKNLQVSATGGNASVSVSYDEIVLEDGSNAYVTARAGSLTINSAGSGANGLDTGTLAASTWYSVWVIRKPDGTTAGLISTSATAPTMPSGYTFKARVGWIRTDSTGNKYPLGFKQFGRRVQYLVGAGNVANLPLMANGTMGTYPNTYAAVSTSNFVPSTACMVRVSVVSNTNSAAAVSPNASYGGVASMTNPPLLSMQSYPNGYSEMTLESSNIYAVSSGTIVLGCVGWEDNL